MTEQIRPPLLRRMTREGRPPPEFGEVSPVKALRLALSKAGQDLLDQVVSGGEMEERKIALAKIADSLPAGALTIALSGPNGGQGLVVLDKGLVTGLTEALTIGRVGSGPVPERDLSVTDGSLCQQFLVMVLTVFAARLVGHPAAEWATGFVPEDPVTDLRRLAVIMADVPYRQLSIEVDLAQGARAGQMVLILPWEGRRAEPLSERGGGERAQAAWMADMAAALAPAEVVLEAVLYSFHLPLEKLMALREGDLLPIPRRAIAELELRGLEGEPVTQARLGQSQGFRAVRLEQVPLAPDLSPAEDLDGPGAPLPPPDPVEAMAMAPAMGDGMMGEGMEISPAMGLDLPASDEGGIGELPDLGDLPAMEDLPDLGAIGDDAPGAASGPDLGGVPQIDIADLPMDELDDLPATIE